MKNLLTIGLIIMVGAVFLISQCVEQNMTSNQTITQNISITQQNETINETIAQEEQITNLTTANETIDETIAQEMTRYGLKAEYYNDIKIEGDPVATGFINTLNLVWNESNVPENVNWKRFAARFTGKLQIEKEGDYVFIITADDGARLYLDGTLVGDMWYSTGVASRSATKKMTKGIHDIRIDYKNIGGGIAKLKLEYWASSLGIERQVIPTEVLTPE